MHFKSINHRPRALIESLVPPGDDTLLPLLLEGNHGHLSLTLEDRVAMSGRVGDVLTRQWACLGSVARWSVGDAKAEGYRRQIITYCWLQQPHSRTQIASTDH